MHGYVEHVLRLGSGMQDFTRRNKLYLQLMMLTYERYWERDQFCNLSVTL